MYLNAQDPVFAESCFVADNEDEDFGERSSSMGLFDVDDQKLQVYVMQHRCSYDEALLIAKRGH